MKNHKPMQTKTKDRLLTTASVVGTILPLLIAIGINFEEYFIRRAGGLQLGVGGMIALTLVILLAKGKSNVLKGVWGYLIVFMLALCLQPILDDIILLTGMALVGKTTDSVLIQPQLKRVRKIRESGDSADTLGKSLREVFAEQIRLLGGGNNGQAK